MSDKDLIIPQAPKPEETQPPEHPTVASRSERALKIAYFSIAIAFVAAGFSFLQWCAAKKQADAAWKSIGIMQKQLEATDRPWIRVVAGPNDEYIPGAFIGGPLYFDENGQGFLTVKFVLLNDGRSVANSVRIVAKVIALSADVPTDARLPIEEQRKLCHSVPEESSTEIGNLAVSPNAPTVEFDKFKFETKNIPTQITGLKNGTPIRPVLIGCAKYKFGEAAQFHDTGFLYEISGKNEGIQTKKVISVDQLEFRPYFLGGSYAN